MKANITVTPSEASVKYAVELNRKPIALTNGKGKAELLPGQDHTLLWYVFGEPGAFIKITVATDLKDVLEVDKKETQVPNGTRKSGGVRSFQL